MKSKNQGKKCGSAAHTGMVIRNGLGGA
jgi:hypothetical protein